MKKTLAMGALAAAAVLSGPAHAQQAATLERVMQQIEALNQRVGKLEQDNARLSQENKDLAAKNDRLEATSDYLRSNATATRKELAEAGPKIADSDRISKAAEWSSRIALKGDVRFRNENIDQEFTPRDRNRDRMRVRLGAVAKVNDTVTAEVQLTTDEALSGGTEGDARSPNRTLTDASSRKEFDIDTGFIAWAPNANWKVTLGKMRYPFVRPTSSGFFDNDINPEGGAINWQLGTSGLFASAWYFDLAERATFAESNMAGAQLGWRGEIGKTRLMLAGTYFAHAAVQGYNAVQDGNIANAFGNTTTTVGCKAGLTACIASDFDIVQGIAEVGWTVRNQPLTLFVDYDNNSGAETNPVAGDKLDTAYGLGVSYGRVSGPRSWEISYAFEHIEKDALYGQWIDSDFAAGNTDVDGSVIRLNYGFNKNFRLNTTYFLNDTNNDVPAAITGVGNVFDRAYKRLQLDIVASFN